MTVTRRWALFAALAALVVLAAGYLLLVKPQNSKVSSLHTQTDQQNQANALLLTQIAALQSEQKELPQQQLALQKFTTLVPNTPDEPTLIRQLTVSAQRAGVQLLSITPGTPAVVSGVAAGGTTTLGSASAAAPGSTLETMTVALTIIGSYANVEAFFSQIEHFPRAMMVTSFSVCPEHPAGIGSPCGAPAPPSNKVALPDDVGANLTANIFFSPDEAPAPTTGTQTLSGAPAPSGPTSSATPAAGAPNVTGPSTTGAAAGQANQVGG